MLHTGDVIDDGTIESYHAAKNMFAKLRLPIYFLSGNHDHAPTMQREMLGIAQPLDRYDYSFTMGGIQFIALDSFGLKQPGGYLTDSQLTNLRQVCTADGGPIAIFVHHQPLPLDVPWLDEITIMDSAMLISNHAEFGMRSVRQRVGCAVYFTGTFIAVRRWYAAACYSAVRRP